MQLKIRKILYFFNINDYRLFRASCTYKEKSHPIFFGLIGSLETDYTVAISKN